MTGDKNHPAKSTMGSPGNPLAPTKDGFYRDLDNRIYHDKPDIFIRLAKLRQDSKHGLSSSAWPLVIPLAALAGAFMTFGIISIMPEYDAYALLQPFVLLLLFLSLAGVGCFAIFPGIMAVLNVKCKAHYGQTSWYLHNTDFAVLVANEQFGMRILEKTKDLPILKWAGAPTPVSFEDCLWFSACYRNAICQCLSANRRVSGSTNANISFPLAALRHGSCLHFLGTPSARGLAWVALIMSCGFTAIITIPALVTGALRDAERRGSLAAICDFFLGTCEVDVNELPLPPELRQPEPPTPVSSAENVAGMIKRSAHGIPDKGDEKLES